MKRTFLLMAYAFTAFSSNAQANRTIKVTGTRFTFPLFARWIAEYNKIHPGISFVLASGIPADSADIMIASHILQPGDVKTGQQSIAVARYAQLPVINSGRPGLSKLLAKGLTDHALRTIYFSDSSSRGDLAAPFTVYKRQKAACSSVAFANHFGNQHKDIKGIGVTGDDQDLLQAVKADANAISHNSLGVIYNLKSRKLNDSIAIIPIDLDENGRIDAGEDIYANLDALIAFVEKTNHPKIPVENINVIFSKGVNHAAVAEFLKWVILKGRQFNHAYGILDLEPSTLPAQQALLAKANTLNACTPSLAHLKAASITGTQK